MAAAFLYPTLLAKKFEYPFKENQTAFQYAFEKQGNAKYASQHLYATMFDQDRIPCFSYFMKEKFERKVRHSISDARKAYIIWV
jgi:hypothetical protein